MNMFTPPTDNLYKFMALSGVVLIIAGVYFPLVYFRQTGMEYLAQLRDSDELRVHEKFVNQRLETLKLREQQAIDTKNKLQQRLDRVNSASNSTEMDKLEGRLKEVNREIESIADSSYELNFNLALKRVQVNSEEPGSFNRRRDSLLTILVGAIGVLFGLIVSPIGFLLWYKKLQWHQDRVAAKETEDKLAPTQMNQQIEQNPPNPAAQVNVPKSIKVATLQPR